MGKPKPKIDRVMQDLAALSNPKHLKSMREAGINTEHAYGIPPAILNRFASRMKHNQALAVELWHSEVHEAKLLGSMLADPAKTTEDDIEYLARNFDSWDLVDAFVANLFIKTRYAYPKALEYSSKRQEFMKRTGFVLMANYALFKDLPDSKLEKFFSFISKESTDERNYVKKAVSWALRNIGKRNPELNKKAIAVAKRIEKQESDSARWIAKDVLREIEKKFIP